MTEIKWELISPAFEFHLPRPSILFRADFKSASEGEIVSSIVQNNRTSTSTRPGKAAPMALFPWSVSTNSQMPKD